MKDTRSYVNSTAEAIEMQAAFVLDAILKALEILDDDHPARGLLEDARKAAQQVLWNYDATFGRQLLASLNYQRQRANRSVTNALEASYPLLEWNGYAWQGKSRALIEIANDIDQLLEQIEERIGQMKAMIAEVEVQADAAAS